LAVERSVFRRRVAPADDLIVGALRTRAVSGGFGVLLASRVTLAARQDGTA
jgi:hypothetical protein